MSGLARKILIFAATEGLVLQPLTQRDKKAPILPIQISYRDHVNEHLFMGKVDEYENETAKNFEAFGIVGILSVSNLSFLISITKRQLVAQIHGKPIYVITEVALTPLASRAEAEMSIGRTQALLLSQPDGVGLDYSDSDGEEAVVSDDVEDDEINRSNRSASIEHEQASSVAEDIFTKKGAYGRFAQKWFSKKGWTVDQRRNLGITGSEPKLATPTKTKGIQVSVSERGNAGPYVNSQLAAKEQKTYDGTTNMLPKLLRTAQVLFSSSRSFYFSYDWDITKNFKDQQASSNEKPLHSQAEAKFFWNHHLLKPFIDAGHTSYALPLMQGFVGQRSFEMDSHPPQPIFGLDGAAKSSLELADLSARSQNMQNESESSEFSTGRRSGGNNVNKKYLLTLISRRSVQRAGLRYLRRGIDEQGFAANFVETEQILSSELWSPSARIYSFLQVRGSIPVFWSQSPYSFKPIPQLQLSEETNYRGYCAHIKNLTSVYGDVQAVSLVEKHGPEAIVGKEYEKYVDSLNKAATTDAGLPVSFIWWDFHTSCRGMKFENVGLLIDMLAEKLERFGDTTMVDGILESRQSGIVRTNCMDCLDRTNVAQSACARRMLELQLKRDGIDMSLQLDQTTQWFNTLWADNGDAISKQYASTSALKGDFTRTRKRELAGALKDIGLSISRFYSGIVNDYFSQAAIDFLLGNVTELIFEDFNEKLMTVDPAVSMQKLRQQAIEMCQKQIVADKYEEFIGGWTLLTPSLPNTIKSMPFEESVLLLTDAGLYLCRFDWSMEKPTSFERIDLQQIQGIRYGTYITSTLSAAQTNEEHNVGFVITYQAGPDEMCINSRAVTNANTKMNMNMYNRAASESTRVLALKALPSRSAIGSQLISEMAQVQSICGEIERLILAARVMEVGEARRSLAEPGDIISLAEARKSTGLLEQLSHSIKKLVWA